MPERGTSKERLEASEQLADFIACGGDAKEFMRQFHPEDAVVINDMAFAVLRQRNLASAYPVNQADADCLPFLALCSTGFVRDRKEMTQSLLRAFDAYCKE